MASIRRTHATIDDAQQRVALEKLRSLVFFGAWTNHCSFYPGSAATLKKFRTNLKNFRITKGTIHFSPDKPLPVAVVKKLVKARIAENNNRANTNRKTP